MRFGAQPDLDPTPGESDPVTMKPAPARFFLFLILTLSLVAVPPVWGQLAGEYNAAAQGMETLDEGSTGGGGAGQNVLDSLRGGQATPPGGAPPGGFGPPGAASGAAVMPGAEATPAGEAAAGVDAVVAPISQTRTYAAFAGRRVYDAVTYRRNPNTAIILDDIRRIDITEDQLSEFSDDGTQGDVEPNDSVYAQILPTSTNEYIGAESAFYLEKVIYLLGAAEQMDPLEFFGLTALTSERVSDIPKYRERVAEKDSKIYSMTPDGKITGWADSFLRLYRVETDNPDSKFFPLYIPRFPDPPAIPPPPAPWRPWGTPSLDVETPFGAVGAPGGATYAVPQEAGGQ